MKVCVKQSLLMLFLLCSLPARAVVSPGQNMWGIVQQTADTVDQMSETVSIMDDTINTLASGCVTTPITTAMTITTSGSYCLSNNIQGNITINADSVTLDLNGYTITPGTGVTGVTISPNHEKIHIKNGFIFKGAFGVFLFGAGQDIIISDIEVSEMNGSGLSLAGTNTTTGVLENLVVKNCVVARSSGSTHVLLSSCINSVIKGCVVEVTGNNRGIVVAQNSVNVVVDDCIVNCLASQGANCFEFDTAVNCKFNKCTAMNAGFSGLSRGFSLVNAINCQVMSCSAINNITGFFATGGSNNLFVNNCALNNGTNYSIGATPNAPLTSSTDATMNFWKNYQAP